MNKRNRATYINNGMLLLIFIAMSLSVGISNAQNHASTKTVELAVLSENLSSEDLTEIRRLLEAGAHVDVKNKWEVTPLFMASQKGHVEIVKLLLGSKADVNAASKTEGITPLLIDSQKGHTEVVNLLPDKI